MTMYAIRHTFPNGGTLGDGFIHSGNVRPQPIALYDTLNEAQASADRMTARNPGHTFTVVVIDNGGDEARVSYTCATQH